MGHEQLFLIIFARMAFFISWSSQVGLTGPKRGPGLGKHGKPFFRDRPTCALETRAIQVEKRDRWYSGAVWPYVHLRARAALVLSCLFCSSWKAVASRFLHGAPTRSMVIGFSPSTVYVSFTESTTIHALRLLNG